MYTNPMVNKLIRKLLTHCEVTMCMDTNEEIYFDLNTGMRSHAHMYIYSDHLIICKRDWECTEIDLDQSFQDVWSDVISCIESCAQGRADISHGWARHLEEFYG